MKRFWHAVELVVAAVCSVPAALLVRLGLRPSGVTIIGWWGSETVGDIAILGQLLEECSQTAPGRALRIVSFSPTITRASLTELQRADVAVVPVGLRSALALLRSHAVIVGGGPLMDSPSMRVWLWRLRLARMTGARTMLYANGIGPVRQPATARAIQGILRAATHIALRDRASLEWAAKHEPDATVLRCLDPAWSYARARRRAAQRDSQRLVLALRLPPQAYLADADAVASGEQFLTVMAELLNRLSQLGEWRFIGCVMHEGLPSSDDRELYARLRLRLDNPERLTVAPGRHSVAMVLDALQGAAAALTVRFHGFVLAAATDTPVVAIEYGRPTGKVSAAAELLGLSSKVVQWDDVSADTLLTMLHAAVSAAPASHHVLIDGAGDRLALLRELMM